MPAKKSTQRRKRGVPGPKMKQTLADKKKHVRELAKEGRWADIERLYGKKILAKAKIYAGVVKTPQEIAREIMIKNGLMPSAPQAAAITTLGVESGTRTNEPRVEAANESRIEAAIDSSSSETLTKEQQELIEKRRREALERRRLPQNSPVALTKKQQERIESRRREALEKRQRAQQFGVAHAQLPVVIQPDPVDYSRRDLQPSVVPLQDPRHQPPSWVESSRSTLQPQSKTHRVVTPENLPTANSTVEPEQVRPEYFWDDLEAAAEIVQWENEHRAEVALVQPPAKTVRDSIQEVSSAQGQQMQQGEIKTRASSVSTITSLSQELAAAAEIFQWEKEHEVSPAFNRPGDRSDSDHELDVPQFQLMPVIVTEDFEKREQNPIEAPVNDSKQTRHAPCGDSQPTSKSHRKRPMVAAPPPALPHSSVISSKTANSDADSRRRSTSSNPSTNQHNPTEKFINKHLLDDKLELPVLEFLDMMLA